MFFFSCEDSNWHGNAFQIDFFFFISFYFGRRLSSATRFDVLTFKSSVFRCAKYTVSSSRNRVQTKRWILVNPTVLTMQTASQQNAIEIVIMGWLVPGRRALTVIFCGLRVDEFYWVAMRQVWEITQSTVCFFCFFASSQYIRGFVEDSEVAILVIKWLTALTDFLVVLKTWIYCTTYSMWLNP